MPLRLKHYRRYVCVPFFRLHWPAHDFRPVRSMDCLRYFFACEFYGDSEDALAAAAAADVALQSQPFDAVSNAAREDVVVAVAAPVAADAMDAFGRCTAH